ncbi:Tn3 family transposase [Streptomyces sp. NPDC054855]
MLPRVDLPEVSSWTGADQAFTSVTGSEARLKDLHVTIATLLVAPSCNVGYTPVIGAADARKYGCLPQSTRRICDWRRTGRRTPPWSTARRRSRSRRVWSCGLVASVDGMRFVVPVPSAYALPNPKCFRRQGAQPAKRRGRAGRSWPAPRAAPPPPWHR